MTLMFKALFFIIVFIEIAEGGKGDCPALTNDKMGWSRGKALLDAITLENCMDLHVRCDQCHDLCNNPDYTQWLIAMCPKTCGFC